MKIEYNSPLILSFSITAGILFVLNILLNHILDPILILGPGFNFLNIFDYMSLVTYTLGHANTQHLFGNLSLILILGPIIEEKYGSILLSLMMVITALSTALLHLLFFNSGLLGASGIVFMLIVLSSITNTRKGIPLTFILVMIFYLGNEVLASASNDNISHFAHILGGLSGAFFGFILRR